MDPDHPVYQVNIFTRLEEPARLPVGERGFRVSEWKLSEADVTEVLAWAADTAAGRPYTVAVAAASVDDSAHHLHLFGDNPTTTHFGSGEHYIYAAEKNSDGSAIVDDARFS